MIQRLRLLGVTLFALYCGSAFPVGLGDIELKSALNQRFDAEIVLSNIGDLQQDEIIPNLASQQDFDRVGVSRDYNLTDLRFKVRVREDNAYVVHITSSKPIIEPFLNFIVEAIWPNGRILREYTVLLDPPVFSTEGIEKIEPGMSGRSAPAKQPGGRSSNRREIPPAPSVSAGRTEGVVTQDDEYGLTGPGDTLWTIALKVRPNSSISVQQTMLALQRANPEAFINNNINLLKAGHVLRIPDENEIRTQTTTEAISEVRAQNQEFEDYRSGDVTQLDARRTSNQSTGASDDSDDGELKLLASDQTGSRSGEGNARVGELENSLAVAREDLDRSRRANNELNVRLDDLAGQVETLSELVKLKDDQLAALQAEVKRQAAATLNAPAVPVVPQQQASGSLLSNPLVLGGIGVLLIALVAGALIMFRKRRQDSELEDDEFAEVMIEEAEPQLSLDDDAGENSEAAIEDADEDVTQQTSDVIGEAEIYIAYGRFPQAISFLQNAIEKEPQRADIQLRLLEVYVQTEDATAFNLQFEQLKLLGDDEATSKGAEFQAQIPGAAETSAAAMDATIVSSEPIVAIEDTGSDDDDDLSFDLDDLDADADDDLDLTADAGEALSLDEAMELGDAELDLDLDAALEEVTAANEEEDLDLDLGLDDEIDLDFDDDTGDELSSTTQLDADSLELGEEDSLELGGDDDEFELDLDLDDDEIKLDLGDDDALELDLDDDDGIELDLGEEDSLELDDDDAIELDLGDDDDISLDLEDELDLDDDDELDLGSLDDDDELNLDEDASSKLDLARAYIEMGDNDGAKSLLEEVVSEGDDEQVSEANELLGNIK